MDQNFGAAETADTVADMVFLASAEEDAGGIVVSEVIHDVFLLDDVMLQGRSRFLKAQIVLRGKSGHLTCCVCEKGAIWSGKTGTRIMMVQWLDT